MDVLPGSSYYGEFTTAHPISGESVDADLLPVAFATRNGTDDPNFILTVFRLDIGRYAVSGIVPSSYASGDVVQIAVEVSVAGVYGTDTIDILRIVSSGFTSPSLVTTYPVGQTIGGLERVYCTDEDIAVRATIDYPTICPDSQVQASGTDGVFRAGSPWILESASESFLAQGVHVQNVCILTGPSPLFKNPQLLTVEAVSANSLILRRLGKAAGQGHPPAPAGGQSGVSFSIPTFDPQIDNATYDANKWYGIDPNVAIHGPESIYDIRALRQFCVLHVLTRAYASAMRGGSSSHLQIRLAQLNSEFSDLKASTVVQWGQTGRAEMPTSIFNTRVRR